MVDPYEVAAELTSHAFVVVADEVAGAWTLDLYYAGADFGEVACC